MAKGIAYALTLGIIFIFYLMIAIPYFFFSLIGGKHV